MNTTVPPVLVVEDDADSRIMIATLLTIHGYLVVTADSGMQGLLMAREHEPCLILLDLMMPGMSGVDFRHEQHADPSIANVPVAVISAHPDAERIAREIDAICCIGKPVSFERLTGTVDAYCRR